jgi:hypothetical protein
MYVGGSPVLSTVSRVGMKVNNCRCKCTTGGHGSRCTAMPFYLVLGADFPAILCARFGDTSDGLHWHIRSLLDCLEGGPHILWAYALGQHCVA